MVLAPVPREHSVRMENSAVVKTAPAVHQQKLAKLAVMDSLQTLVNANVLECSQMVFVLVVPVASSSRHKILANRVTLSHLTVQNVMI